MMLLAVEGLKKRYTRGALNKVVTFSLSADFEIEAPAVVGVMGPNGSGKTTLFELITGSNRPTAGRVVVCGKDIHRVRSDERDRLAIHYHQAYQVRRFARRLPNFMLERAGSDYPMTHLFDEPQFNIQDGYIACTRRNATISTSCARFASATCLSSRARSAKRPTSKR
jgi:ABC-type oligopeptide transport system ATPase subunit